MAEDRFSSGKKEYGCKALEKRAERESLLFLFIMRYRALCPRHLIFNKWRRGSLRHLVESFIVSFYRKHPVFRMSIRQALYTRHRIGKICKREGQGGER